MTTELLFCSGRWRKRTRQVGQQAGRKPRARAWTRLRDSLSAHAGGGHPDFERWKGALHEELDKLYEGALLVGHSIGATVLAHSLAEDPPHRLPAGIFLISMPVIGRDGWTRDDIGPEPELGARLPADAPVYLYQGSADKIVVASHADLNAQAIPQAVVRKLPGRDHQLDNDMSEVARDIRELSGQKPQRDRKRARITKRIFF